MLNGDIFAAINEAGINLIQSGYQEDLSTKGVEEDQAQQDAITHIARVPTLMLIFPILMSAHLVILLT
jgi:hypothetical protein